MTLIKHNGAHIDPLDFDDFEAVQDWLRTTFDADIAPTVIAMYSADDETALNEEFNNWTDSLCKDGIISESIYNEVCRT